MRPIVSYDDISLPMTTEVSPSRLQDSQPPPSKKQKKSNQKLEEVEDSRELTNDEIWDDSALIDAWNAATEEYETFHGSNKDWKREPVKKSPLWYNAPPSPYPLKKPTPQSVPGTASKSGASNGQKEIGTDVDSKPLNFDTFVPNHDPSLTLPTSPYPSGPVLDYSGHRHHGESGPMVSQDEAFTRAMGAMYWAGYYSAVYRCHRTPDDEVDEQDFEEHT